MKGPTAEPPVNMIRKPSNSKISMSGSNQYFFRTFIYAQRSLKNSIGNSCFEYLSEWFFQVGSIIQMFTCFHDRLTTFFKFLQK